MRTKLLFSLSGKSAKGEPAGAGSVAGGRARRVGWNPVLPASPLRWSWPAPGGAGTPLRMRIAVPSILSD